MDNHLVLKFIRVGASLVGSEPPLSSLCVPILLDHKDNPQWHMLTAEIRAMVAKEAVIPFPQIQVQGFIATFSW